MDKRLRPTHLLRETTGASTVQQAILIALIVGGAFLALDGLGLVASKTFSTTSTQLSGQELGTGAGSATATGRPEAGSPTVSAHAPLSKPAVAGSFLLRLIVMVVACPLGALCWYLLNRKELRSEVEDEELPPVAQTDSQIERDLLFDKRHNLLRLFNADIGMLMTSRIMVKHVMSEKVYSVLPTASVEEVRELMREKKIRHVLVCDKQGKLVGLVTVRAIEEAVGKSAADAMQPNPPIVCPTSLLNPAITQIIKQRLYCLPVVKDGELVGVLTSTDVMLALQCTLHALQKTAHEVASDLPAGMVPGFMVALNAEQDNACEDHPTELANA